MPLKNSFPYKAVSAMISILLPPWIILTFVMILINGLYIIPVLRIFNNDWKTAARKFIIASGHVLCASFWPWTRIKVLNKEKLKDVPSYIIISNHTSFFDIAFNSLTPGLNRLIFAKTWVHKIPFLKYYIKWAGYVNTDTMVYEETLKEIRGYRNYNLMIYPEGTRSKDGNIQRFRSGAFKFSQDLKIPVVPVHIEGGMQFGHPRFPYLRPCRITMTILDPVYPEDFENEPNPHLKMRKETRRQLRMFAGEIQ